MRLPIILTLLVLFTLPADLDGLATQLNGYYQGAATAVGDFLDRNKDDGVVVAEATQPAAKGNVLKGATTVR